MRGTDLLAEITQAFQDEPHPGEWHIVYSNASDDPEVIRLRESFKVYTWRTIPDDILQYEQNGYIYLSNAGLRHYLPAYLHYSVREYRKADGIPDGLVFLLKLSTEADILRSALDFTMGVLSQSSAYSSPAAASSKYNHFQERLQDLNITTQRFISRWS